MLWADVQVGEGWLVGAAGFVTAGAAAIVSLMGSRHKARLDELGQAVANYQTIIDRQERQIERYEASQREHADALSSIADEHATCRRQINLLIDCLHRQNQAIIDLGGKPAPLPDFRAAPAADTEFTKRTLAQNQQLLQGIDHRIAPEDKPHESAGS